MPKTNYGSNFYRVWKLGSGRATIVRRPRVGETWVFVQGKKKREATGFKATGYTGKTMETLSATGVIISSIENIGKGVGFAHAVLTSGFKVAKEKAVAKFTLVNHEKEANANRLANIHGNLDKMLDNQSQMESDIAELKKGMALLLQDGKAGGVLVRGKKKGESDSDKKNGGDANGGPNGGSNGNANGSANGNSNGGPNGISNGGFEIDF